MNAPSHNTATRPTWLRVSMAILYVCNFGWADILETTGQLGRVLVVLATRYHHHHEQYEQPLLAILSPETLLLRMAWIATAIAFCRNYQLILKHVHEKWIPNPKRRPLVRLPVSLYQNYNDKNCSNNNSHSSSTDDTCCAICWTKFQPNSRVCIGRTCRHAFHDECIHMWISYSTTSCPCCRQDLWSGPPLEDTNNITAGRQGQTSDCTKATTTTTGSSTTGKTIA